MIFWEFWPWNLSQVICTGIKSLLGHKDLQKLEKSIKFFKSSRNDLEALLYEINAANALIGLHFQKIKKEFVGFLLSDYLMTFKHL